MLSIHKHSYGVLQSTDLTDARFLYFTMCYTIILSSVLCCWEHLKKWCLNDELRYILLGKKMIWHMLQQWSNDCTEIITIFMFSLIISVKKVRYFGSNLMWKKSCVKFVKRKNNRGVHSCSLRSKYSKSLIK